MDRAAFQTFHPAVPAVLFAGIIVMAMFSLEPHLVLSSLAFALLFALVTQGVKAALDKLRWQMPLLVLVCIINPLFSARGTHLLVKLGPFPVYAESIAFGLVMGALLVSVLMWIENMAYLVGRDEVLMLGGGALPTIALMLSMTLHLVPQLVSRAATVRTALQATTSRKRAAGRDGAGERRRRTGGRLDTARVRVMDALISWALEDSIERGDAMRARGWGAAAHRSSYDPHPFRTRDLLALSLLAGLIVLAAFSVHDIVAGWDFYPAMTGTAPAWSFAAPLALFAAPLAIICAERIRWEGGA